MTEQAAPTISIATYNVLAAAYADPKYYPGVQSHDVASATRYPRVVHRIAELDADVICLQEVDHELFAMVDARLQKQGYRSRWAHKGRGKPDGCAMFVAPNLLLGEWRIHEFDDAAFGGKRTGHLVLSTNVMRGHFYMHVATTHLKWEPPGAAGEERVGLLQARQTLRQLPTQVRIAGTPCVICGDFNAGPSSDILRTFADERFVDAHGDLSHTFVLEGVPQKLDYLLFSMDTLVARPVAVPSLPGPTPMPSAAEPSDHLPLVARFTRR